MYSYEIDNARALITFEGDLDGPLIRKAYDEVLNDPAFQPGFQVLVDDQATTFDPSLEEAQRLAEFFGTLGDLVSHFAIVVDKEFHFGIGRMVEVFCEGHGISLRIFRSLGEAKAWLGAERS